MPPFTATSLHLSNFVSDHVGAVVIASIFAFGACLVTIYLCVRHVCSWILPQIQLKVLGIVCATAVCALTQLGCLFVSENEYESIWASVMIFVGDVYVVRSTPLVKLFTIFVGLMCPTAYILMSCYRPT
jgi:hypothetical protein